MSKPPPPDGNQLYDYRAKVKRIVDGDTIELVVDLGFRMTMTDSFRLFGIDAWETRGAERSRGLLAKDRLEQMCPVGSDLLIRTYKDKRGKYGRWIAEMFVEGHDVCQILVDEGHAKRVDY